MNTSEKIAELATALAKAQGAIGHAAKDRTNPAFKARYADLASVIDASRDALAANGLAVLQPVTIADGVVHVGTRIVHASGEWAECVVSIVLADQRAHAIGSAITYGRRYGLSAMVGVAPDDDDGNVASGSGGARSPHIAERTPQTFVPHAPDPKPALKLAPEVDRALATIGRDFPKRLRDAIALVEGNGGGIAELRAFYSACQKMATGDAIAKEYDRAGSGGFTGD